MRKPIVNLIGMDHMGAISLPLRLIYDKRSRPFWYVNETLSSESTTTSVHERYKLFVWVSEMVPTVRPQHECTIIPLDF